MTTELIQWEYRIDHNDLYTDMILDNIGRQGWELTAVVKSPASPDPYRFDYYFKRPIIQSPDKQES